MEKTKRPSQLTPPPGDKTITTDTTTCWIDEDGIAIFVAEGIQTFDHAKENMDAFRKLSNGKKAPVLLDFSNIKTITREAREYYASEESSSLVVAVAIVTNSLIGKLIGNFFLGFNKNKVGAPLKMFTQADDARQWLLQFTDGQIGQ